MKPDMSLLWDVLNVYKIDFESFFVNWYNKQQLKKQCKKAFKIDFGSSIRTFSESKHLSSSASMFV